MASHGQDLADKHARDARTIMTSSFFHGAFPHTRLWKSKQAVSDFMTTQQGSRMATWVSGVLTGRGADVIIIDDPLKPADALSDTLRDAVNAWYDSSLLSRLNNKEEAIIIIVMQRLHQDDLVGHVLELDEEWEVLSFPAIAEVEQSYCYNNAFGSRVFKRPINDVLDPSRESLETPKIMWNLIVRQIWSNLQVSDAGLNLPLPLQNHSSMSGLGRSRQLNSGRPWRSPYSDFPLVVPAAAGTHKRLASELL